MMLSLLKGLAMRKLVGTLGLVVVLALGAATYSEAQDNSNPDEAVCASPMAVTDTDATPGSSSATPGSIMVAGSPAAATPEATLDALAATAAAYECSVLEEASPAA
jgi:hypothetical protein